MPNAPSDHHVEADALGNAFDAMLLKQTPVSSDNFSDGWAAADTDNALALSGVDKWRLKDCIVAALASVWGVLTMHPGQIEACFCLLHPHCLNSLAVVHRIGGGKTHILCTLGVIERESFLFLFPC